MKLNVTKCSSCGGDHGELEFSEIKNSRTGDFTHYADCPVTLELIYSKRVVNDLVNKPSHYTDGKIEVIDFIEDKKLNFNKGNAVKYISRAGKKDPTKEIEDLEKSVWYINREILNLKAK